MPEQEFSSVQPPQPDKPEATNPNDSEPTLPPPPERSWKRYVKQKTAVIVGGLTILATGVLAGDTNAKHNVEKSLDPTAPTTSEVVKGTEDIPDNIIQITPPETPVNGIDVVDNTTLADFAKEKSVSMELASHVAGAKREVQEYKDDYSGEDREKTTITIPAPSDLGKNGTYVWTSETRKLVGTKDPTPVAVSLTATVDGSQVYQLKMDRYASENPKEEYWSMYLEQKNQDGTTTVGTYSNDSEFEANPSFGNNTSPATEEVVIPFKEKLNPIDHEGKVNPIQHLPPLE